MRVSVEKSYSLLGFASISRASRCRACAFSSEENPPRSTCGQGCHYGLRETARAACVRGAPGRGRRWAGVLRSAGPRAAARRSARVRSRAAFGRARLRDRRAPAPRPRAGPGPPPRGPTADRRTYRRFRFAAHRAAGAVPRAIIMLRVCTIYPQGVHRTLPPTDPWGVGTQISRTQIEDGNEPPPSALQHH